MCIKADVTLADVELQKDILQLNKLGYGNINLCVCVLEKNECEEKAVAYS